MKPTVAGTPDQVRETLQRLGFEGRVSLAALSRMLGKPPRYLATFMRGEGDEQLPAADRELLAQFFRVDPKAFASQTE